MMAMRQTLIRLITAILLLVAPAVAVEAQEPTRVWRVGFLGSGSHASGDPRVEALRRGLRELGYAEGRNLTFEFRWAGGNGDRLPALAAELAKLKVDAIVTQGTQATDAARRAVTTIPIVFSVAGDPIGSGLVTSLARPGGNVTGLTDIAPEIAGKRLELLREAVPGITRIAVLWNPANPSAAPQMKDTGAVARSLGLLVRSLELRDLSQLEAAFTTAVQDQARAVIVRRCPLWPTGSDRSARGQTSTTVRRVDSRVRRKWLLHGIWCRCGGDAPARRHFCGQDLERRESRRLAGRAAHQIRAGREPQDGEGARPDDPADGAGPGR